MATDSSLVQTISHVYVNNSTGVAVGHFSNASSDISDIVTRRVQVRDRLRLTDPADDREALQSQKGRRVPGTCQWLRSNPDYQKWLHGNTGGLWISGHPGKGKTMLSIFLTEELDEHMRRNDGVLLYYFCSHDDEKRNTETSIIRGLLFQLVQSVPTTTFEQLVWPKFASEETSHYTVSNVFTMWKLFTDIVTSKELKNVCCILDGLDECDRNSSKQAVEQFHALINKAAYLTCTFRLAIISRELPGLSGFSTIPLDNHQFHVYRDIKLVILDNIRKTLSHKASFDADYLGQLSRRLTHGSEGSFLWIGFVIQELSDYETTLEIERALQNTPKGLESLYNRILHQIYAKHRDHRHLIYRLIAWVSLAFRPLTVSELTRAVMGSVSVKQEKELAELLSYCKHIVVVDSRTRIVRLVHASAKEFLIKLPATVSSNAVSNQTHIDVGHRMITRICLELLERDEEDDALRQYAAKQWVHHIKACRPEDTTRELSRPFFEDMSSVQIQWKQWRLLQDRRGCLPESLPTALHAALYWDITPWAKKLLLKPTSIWTLVLRRKYLEVKDETGMTPLMVAVKQRNSILVRLLLQSGAVVALQPDLNCSNGDSSAILVFFDEFFKDRHEPIDEDYNGVRREIFELLLQHLRKPTWLFMLTSAEFRCACAHLMGQFFVRWFLNNCGHAQMNHKTVFECTALVEAARVGDVVLVERLLNSGADPESIFENRSAVSAAIGGGKYRSDDKQCKILGMLLDKYETKPSTMRAVDERHVLLRSSCKEWLQGFELFESSLRLFSTLKSFDRYEDLCILQNQKRLTTLFEAISSGYCVDVCLERNRIGRFSQSGYSGSPELIEALWRGHISVARLLLENGASVDTVNRDGSSVLILATKYGDWEVAEFLLHQGADIHLAGYGKTTPLIEAVSPKAITKKSYIAHANRRLTNLKRSTVVGPGREAILREVPISRDTFRDKKLLMISCLLRLGASTHCRTSDGRSALSIAAGLGDIEIVEVLVDNGAKITMDDAMSNRGLWRWYVSFYRLRKDGFLSSLRCERLLAFRLKILSKRRRSSLHENRIEYYSGTALDMRDNKNNWDAWLEERPPHTQIYPIGVMFW